jgi:hypothetical protein
MTIDYSPITGIHSALNGFLSGCLLAGGLFSPLGVFVQVIFFIAGVFVLLDAFMPSGEIVYDITVFILAAVGFVTTAILSILQYEPIFLTIIALITVFSYLYRFKGPKRKKK